LRDFDDLDDFYGDYEFIREKSNMIVKLERYGLLVSAFKETNYGYRRTNTLFSKAIQQAINERDERIENERPV
jgi:hypothetical protein